MKRKIDYPYIVCIIFLVLAGVLMNYLLSVNHNLKKEVEFYQKAAERQEQFYQQVTDLYFTGLQSVQIESEKYNADLLKEGLVICLPTTPLDSLERAAFKHTLTRLQGLKGCKVGVWLYGDESGEVAAWLKEYEYESIYSVKKPAGLPDASVFYLDSEQHATAFFRIQPYTVHLLDKYSKFIRDHYQ